MQRKQIVSFKGSTLEEIMTHPASMQIPRTSAPEHWPIFSARARRLIPRWSDI